MVKRNCEIAFTYLKQKHFIFVYLHYRIFFLVSLKSFPQACVGFKGTLFASAKYLQIYNYN